MPPGFKMLTDPDEHFGPKVGLILKTFNPALEGTEALEKYRQGDRSGVVISVIQALGGPIRFAAGLINATRKKMNNKISKIN